ncbi:hypothetical protein ACXO8O_09455, partial [Lactobacillus delbrueckii subsp. bulgaricus]
VSHQTSCAGHNLTGVNLISHFPSIAYSSLEGVVVNCLAPFPAFFDPAVDRFSVYILIADCKIKLNTVPIQ